jgi:hypothetical protein
MNVVLRTHDDAKYLALLDMERFSDDSGYCADLVVRSDSFAGHMRFCFEPGPLAAFADAVEQMDRDLSGAATLQPLYEETFITLKVDHVGRINVSGELVRYAEHTHRLAFSFTTDQTCLGPLARDLRACMFIPAV